MICNGPIWYHWTLSVLKYKLFEVNYQIYSFLDIQSSVMSASTAVTDFTALESFHLLYKNLWSMNIAYRVKQNLVDTVLYKEGRPFSWLFTSEQTGVLFKAFCCI